jgi:hypothetical protein
MMEKSPLVAKLTGDSNSFIRKEGAKFPKPKFSHQFLIMERLLSETFLKVVPYRGERA